MGRNILASKISVVIDAKVLGKEDLRALDAQVDKTASGFGNLKSSIVSAFTSPTAILAGASAITGAVTTVGIAVFDLAKETSDYGSIIHDLGEKTGLSAETISSIKFAADQSGSSIEDFSQGLVRFEKTVGEAARGSDEAKAKLIRLGIDPKAAINDLEGALGKAFKTIHDAPPGIRQTNAAMDAFGKSGASLIPTINAADGDLKKLVQTAKNLGVTFSDEDAKAADEFGDTLDTLAAQIRGLGFSIGREVMPQITGGMRLVSNELSEQRSEWDHWGRAASTATSVAIGVVAALYNQYLVPIEKVLNRFTTAGDVAGRIAKDIFPEDKAEAGGTLDSPFKKRKRDYYDYDNNGTRDKSSRATHKNTPEDRGDKLLEQLTQEHKMLAALSKESQVRIQLEDKAYAKLNDTLKDQIINRAKDIDLRKVQLAIQKQREVSAYEFADFLLDQKRTIREFDFPPTAMDAVDDMIEKHRRLGAYVNEEAEAWARWNANVIDNRKAIADFNVGVETNIDILNRLAEAADRAAASEKHLFDIEPPPPFPEAQKKDRRHRFDLTGRDTEDEVQRAEKAIDGLKRAWGDVKEIGENAVGTFASGIGSMVENFILLGSTGPAALKKLTAQALASVAAESAVKAIYWTAQGIVDLFFNPARAAADFAGAALFASIAGVTAFAGRAIAGDSFKNNGAGGGGGYSSRPGTRAYTDTNGNSATLPTNQITPSGTPARNSNNSSVAQALNRVAAAVEENTAATRAHTAVASRLEGISPGKIVAMGARQNPHAFGRGVLRSMDRDASVTDGISRRQNTE
jgi:hypothetical protein